MICYKWTFILFVLSSVCLVFVFVSVTADDLASNKEKRNPSQIQKPEPPRFKVCYGSLGCFKQEHPFFSFERPVIYPPASPEEIGTVFLLHTRNNPDFNVSDTLIAGNHQSIEQSNFNKTLRVTFIIHGFTSGEDSQWIKILTMELLTKEDVNVIVVGWQKGSEFPYEQATSNTRVVGAQVAQMINFLIDNFDVKAEECLVIGHSLGAHIAGYAGDKVKNLGRITGLDPASIFFTQNITSLRLDASDATFVQVIHTNGGDGGFGLSDELGHVDFYVNNGREQPGCFDDKGEVYQNCLKHSKEQATMIDPIEPLTCSHHRSIVYYTESISFDCPYWGYKCNGEAAFELGHCWPCRLGDTCNKMGHDVIPSIGRQSYFVKTNHREPFCHYHFKVDLFMGLSMIQPARGKVELDLAVHGEGPFQRTKHLHFGFNKNTRFLAGNVTSGVFGRKSEDVDLMDRIDSASMTYKKYEEPFFWLSPYSRHLDVNKIAVETMNDDGELLRKEFCGESIIHSRVPNFHQFKSSKCSNQTGNPAN